MPKSKKHPRYTIIIQWSEEDGCFVASLPEWAPYAVTDAMGATYEEAAKNAREILEILTDDENSGRTNLPKEKLFRYPGADVVNLPYRQHASSHTKTTVRKSRRSA